MMIGEEKDSQILILFCQLR